MRPPTLKSFCTVAAVLASALFIWLQLQPNLLLASTTPAGGDMGAHVWGPAFLRDHLLHHGRISGWSPDWYNGFPAYQYYFPLPSILIVLLDVVLPYGVAFKLVTVLGLVTLPAAAAFLGGSLELPFPTPPLMAVATVPFVFDRFHTIWGGNAAATLAGEFSFSISLAFALVFLGFLARALRTGYAIDRALASVFLAATFLCHLIPGAFAVLAAVALICLRPPDRARWRLTALVGVIGMALTGFWLMPFLLRLRYTNDMGWERTWDYVNNLFPFLRHDTGAPAAYTEHYKVLVPLAALGAVIGVIRRRRGAFALVAIAALMAGAFRYVPAGPIWNARLLPFWYLSLYLLAALALGELAMLVAEGLFAHDAKWAAGIPGAVTVVATFLVVFLVVGGPLGVVPTWLGTHQAANDKSFVPDWARWNYSGYERKPAYEEYRGVVSTMASVGRRVGCGRAMWEYEPQLDRYGTPMALMLLPYWTKGCIGSQEGLFFESSATVPYHFLNQSELSKTPSRAQRDLPYRDLDVRAGVQHLQLLGVRYYMAISPDAQAQASENEDLRLVATTKPFSVNYPDGAKDRFWQVYEVTDSATVVGLTDEPVVAMGITDKKAWLGAAVGWYQDPSRWDVPLADAGPAEWRRIPTASTNVPAGRGVREARVSNIKSTDDRISFDVDAPGTPVLVKTSYFPNWKASGADGPYRVTPNFMVVVPTAKHVELHYGWTGLDLFAWLITFVGAAGVVAVGRAGRVRFPERRPPPEAWIDPFAGRDPLVNPNGSDALEPVGARPNEPPTA